MSGEHRWEDAVRWMKSQPDLADQVRWAYFDDPLALAAKRFASSDEWLATASWLSPMPGQALDLGAGNGIASYALASMGWHVWALEPDPSLLVGAGAVRHLRDQSAKEIQICRGMGEALPFQAGTFDLVYGRQVLHHAADLTALCREVCRVLREGGQFIGVREHVISRAEDLGQFRAAHSLDRYYGGENAFTLPQYTRAMRTAGLRDLHAFGPYETAINLYPRTEAEYQESVSRRLGSVLRIVGRVPGLDRAFRAAVRQVQTVTCQTPGRLYSFLAYK
jgi:SAM-dependent methyltransferase